MPRPRPPSGRDQQALAPQLPAVTQDQDELVAVPSGRRRLLAHVELDAVLAQRAGQRLTEGAGLAARWAALR
jgi:hypothetical protein